MAENAVPGKGILIFVKGADGQYRAASSDNSGALNVNGSISASLGAFNYKGQASIASVGTGSSNVALATADATVVLRNTGANDCNIKFGSGAVTAALTDFLLKAGEAAAFDNGGSSNVAAITASGATTLKAYSGTGLTVISSPSGSGGGGGNVNLNQVGGAAYALGAAAMAASMPVTISSDQTNLPLNLKAVNGTAFALGQTTKSASLPMTLASDQGNLPVAVQDRTEITGTISSAAVFSNFPVIDTIGYRCMALQVTAIAASSTIVVEESNDGTTWTNLTSIGGATSITTVGLHSYNFSAKQIRARQSVYGGSGSSSVTAELRLAPLPFPIAYGAGAVDARTNRTTLASDDPAVTALNAINTATGAQADAAWTSGSGSVIALLKAIAAKIIATVAVTQSGSWTTDPSAVTPFLANALSAKLLVNGAACKLMDYYIYNPNASVIYVQLLDAATTGAVTLGTTVPKRSLGIPPASAANLGSLNLSFASGIVVAATTTSTGSTAPGTALEANFGYR